MGYEIFAVREMKVHECDPCEKFFAVELKYLGDLFCPYCGSDEVETNDKEEGLMISNGATFARRAQS